MTDTINKALLLFMGLAAFLFITHYIILNYALDHLYMSQKWWLNYLFLVPASVIGLFYIHKRFYRSGNIKTIGKNYILYTTVKMVLAIVFLLPWLLTKDESSKPMVIQFFAIFFPFLLVETILLVRLLNTPLDEKNKNEQNQS